MGNLTRARILLSTSQEMVKKKIQGQGKVRKLFLREMSKNWIFFTNSSTLVGFYEHEI